MTIGRDLRDLLGELRPDVVAMEQAFFGKNVQATLALGEARGVALFVAQDWGLTHGLALAGYAAGAGQADRHRPRGAPARTRSASSCRRVLKLKRPPAADAADALAIAL